MCSALHVITVYNRHRNIVLSFINTRTYMHTKQTITRRDAVFEAWAPRSAYQDVLDGLERGAERLVYTSSGLSSGWVSPDATAVFCWTAMMNFD